MGKRPDLAPGDPGSPGVTEVLSQVARSLEAAPDQQHALAGVADAVVTVIDGMEHVGITLFSKEGLSTVAPSDR